MYPSWWRKLWKELGYRTGLRPTRIPIADLREIKRWAQTRIPLEKQDRYCIDIEVLNQHVEVVEYRPRFPQRKIKLQGSQTLVDVWVAEKAKSGASQVEIIERADCNLHYHPDLDKWSLCYRSPDSRTCTPYFWGPYDPGSLAKALKTIEVDKARDWYDSLAHPDWTTTPPPTLEQTRSILLGAALGEAYGASAAGISTGSWGADTARAVAMMESFIRNSSEYCELYSPRDVAKKLLAASERFQSGQTDLESADTRVRDNEALRRTFPLLLHALSLWLDRRIICDWGSELVCEAAALTHADDVSQLSCLYFCEFLRFILAGESIEQAYRKTSQILFHYYRLDDSQWQKAISMHKRILSPNFLALTPADLHPASDVVDTLEIVLYSLLHTNSFREAIETAVSFGGDSAAYAGLTGTVAGAAYGEKAISAEWLAKLKRRDYLEKVAERFQQIDHSSYPV